ncbi:MAG: insulinase family protein, partial [Chloroflexi bacterium]|nr:insulinase family protein [Chloroflexota bacterium]
DLLLNSRFEAEDIEKERPVIIEEINMSNDVPSQRVALLIDELLWPGHPLGRDIAGSRKTVSTVTRNTMLDYLAGHYQPDNTVVAIAGGLSHREMVGTVKQFLGSWDNRQPHPGYSDYVPKTPPRRVKIETRDTEQINLCLALPGLPYLHPKRFQLDILNVILGEGMSSRLFTEIRDKLGLVYGINSFADHFLDTGSLIISAGMEMKNLKTAVAAIVEQLGKLKEPVPESELTKAKEYSKGRLLLRMEDSRSVAGWMGGQAILTGRILTVDQVLSTIDAVTVEELQQLATELLVGDQLRLALVGPVGPDESLEKLLTL